MALSTGSTLLVALSAVSPAAASTQGVGPECASATNASTGQSIQVCAEFGGVIATTTDETVVLACYAVSGPVSVQTAIGCYAQGKTDGFLVRGPNLNVPGDVAATGSEGTGMIQAYSVCVEGGATDLNANSVSLPLTCF